MYHSYLVRVWSEDDEGDTAGWQAEIQQIQSGESWSFSSRRETLDCLHQLLQLQDISNEGERSTE